ncbi:MAG: ribonuclease PH [Nitrospinota bacterium]|nr:ribonuclease PH [Nitrospinota bacterium]
MTEAGRERDNGRKVDELRPIIIETGVNMHAEGSVLISMGKTKVICTASVEERVPPFLKGSGKGWVSAEYSMLPRATNTRTQREASKGKLGGRTMEIQRLIGRALRSVVDFEAMGGETSILIDCDVIQADGGTRTASITGGFVAMYLAFGSLIKKGLINKIPVHDFVAAISVGIVKGRPMLDLNYEEDYLASTDMNVVMTGGGKYVELQGTAEEHPFSKEDLEGMTSLAESGIMRLVQVQKEALKGVL